MNHLKTPVYMVGAGLVIVFLVAILSSTCGLFGIDLVPEGSCGETGNISIPASIIFNVGLTGVFMVFIGTMWTVKAYFIGD
ncbi:hypothetical protein HWN40_04125 [Methanolobus zinderi]|uniref:Uncharacterized protein n=1 Tax=Methanolobus zinderi TaxID=536044 RepID=A0A7D5I4C5_9EURY|nr:hypothetical protein [Methanolobus zinderi]QLC49503.1 hypothetical protein HWN40_04125 [Methanolobus zinderi]